MAKRTEPHVDYVKRLANNSTQSLAPFIVSGKLNVEYIRGNQYKLINPTKMTIEDKKQNPKIYTERKSFNRMFPIYLTRFSILSNNMPIPGFKPQDSSTKRQYDAVRGNDFIKNFLVESNFKQIYNKLVRHADVYGIGWIKTGIDWSQGGGIQEMDVTASSPVGDDKVKSTYTQREGRPFIEFVPMYEVLVDNYNAESIEEINELVHRRSFSLDAIKSRWGIDAEPDSNIDGRGFARSPKYNWLAQKMEGAQAYAYVDEYYKRPDASYPQGRYTLIVGDYIVHDGKLPYANAAGGKRVIPFDIVTLQTLPGHTIGTTVYNQILPMQDTFNSIKNRFLEYINHVAIGQIYYWKDSLVDPGSMSTKPGKMIQLKRNSRPPQPVQKEKLSAEFSPYLKSLEEDMLITAGLSQLTAFGISKSNMRTDGVIDKIDESDQNKLVNAVENLSAAISNAFKKIIYCEQERKKYLETLLGPDKIRDKNLLLYKLEHVDPEQVAIVNRDFLMQNDQILDKKMLQAANLGLYNPELHLPYVAKLQMLDSLQSNYLRETLDPEERATHDLVEEEHSLIWERKTTPSAEQYHSHKQHLYEHNLFRISPEVRMLKDADPEKYEVIMESLKAHTAQHSQFEEGQNSHNSYNDAKAFLGGTAGQQPRPYSVQR